MRPEDLRPGDIFRLSEDSIDTEYKVIIVSPCHVTQFKRRVTHSVWVEARRLSDNVTVTLQVEQVTKTDTDLIIVGHPIRTDETNAKQVPNPFSPEEISEIIASAPGQIAPLVDIPTYEPTVCPKGDRVFVCDGCVVHKVKIDKLQNQLRELVRVAQKVAILQPESYAKDQAEADKWTNFYICLRAAEHHLRDVIEFFFD